MVNESEGVRPSDSGDPAKKPEEQASTGPAPQNGTGPDSSFSAGDSSKPASSGQDSTPAAEPSAPSSEDSPSPEESAESLPSDEDSGDYGYRREESDETFELQEEGGGPVKSFLDHLEDLRWMLIKVAAAVFIAMLVALVAGNRLVDLLARPLMQAERMMPVSTNEVPVLLGTNVIGRIAGGDVGISTNGTNQIQALQIVPKADGTNFVLTVNSIPAPPKQERPFLDLKIYGPVEAFVIALKLALYGGLVLSAPFVIYFLGQFILPALKIREKKFLYRVAGFATALFLLGVAFCYFVIMQITLMATVEFAKWMGFKADEWRAADYLNFVCKFMIGMGLSFELPIVVLTLVKIGLLDYDKLKRFRAYCYVGILVIAAIATPSGDPITMVLMALPLMFLYEVSAQVARFWEWRDRRKEAAA